MKYAYLRTSTEEQNPENQKADVLSIAPRDVVVVLENQSAFKDELKARPKFSEIRDGVIGGVVTEIYCWDLDRLYRNRKQLAELFELCRVKGCKIFSYRQLWMNQMNQVPEPWGEILQKFLVEVFGWIAEDESKKKGDRVKLSMRKRDGVTVSYKGNKWGRKSLPKQTRDKIILLHERGESIRSIQSQVERWVNGNAVKVSRGAVHKIVKDFEQEKSRIRESSKKEQKTDEVDN